MDDTVQRRCVLIDNVGAIHLSHTLKIKESISNVFDSRRVNQITLGVIDVEDFKVESIGFLETLEPGCVDQILDDVSLK